MLRLILFALPFVVGWFLSPQGVPMAASNILAGDAGVFDWVKIGGCLVISIFLCMIPGKK